MSECQSKRPIVARPAIAPALARAPLAAAALMMGVLFLTAAMPILVALMTRGLEADARREVLLTVLNTTAWVSVLGGMLLPGALWCLALHPEGPRKPEPWTANLFQALIAHLIATLAYVFAVVLHEGMGIGGGDIVRLPGLLFTISGLYALFQAKGAIRTNKALIPGFIALTLAMLLHGLLVLRFGPGWRASTFELGPLHLNTIIISHLLLPAGVLAILPVRGVKVWSQWAVAATGFALAGAFLYQSTVGVEATGGKFSPLIHAMGTFSGLLLMHRFMPRKPPLTEPLPAYYKPIGVLRWAGFLFLVFSLVLAFMTMLGGWENFPRFRQAHFHANTLGFLTAWLLAHQYLELEGLIAADKSAYLVLDSQKGFVMAASVLTLLGAFFLTVVFLFPSKPHALSGIGGLCTMAASLLWLRMFMMGHVMASRLVSKPGGTP